MLILLSQVIIIVNLHMKMDMVQKSKLIFNPVQIMKLKNLIVLKIAKVEVLAHTQLQYHQTQDRTPLLLVLIPHLD